MVSSSLQLPKDAKIGDYYYVYTVRGMMVYTEK